MQPFKGLMSNIKKNNFDFTYAEKTKKEIRKDALLQIAISILFFPLFCLPLLLIELMGGGIIFSWFMELVFPSRLINKSKNDLARYIGRQEFIKHFHKLSTKQREKYKI